MAWHGREGGGRTRRGDVELFHDVALVLRVGDVELLAAEEAGDALAEKLIVVEQRGRDVLVADEGRGADLGASSVWGVIGVALPLPLALHR